MNNFVWTGIVPRVTILDAVPIAWRAVQKLDEGSESLRFDHEFTLQFHFAWQVARIVGFSDDLSVRFEEVSGGACEYAHVIGRQRKRVVLRSRLPQGGAQGARYLYQDHAAARARGVQAGSPAASWATR